MQVARAAACLCAGALAAGCGGGSNETADCRDDVGGPSAIFAATSQRGGPPPPGEMNRTVRAICDRAQALELKADVSWRRPDQIVLGVEPQHRSDLGALTAPGRLAFYDWEPNVVGDPDVPFGDLESARTAAARTRRRGVVIVEAERPERASANAPRRYFVLEDDPELSNSDILSPRQDLDRQTREPIVAFEFTLEGRRAFARVTRRIAKRGQATLPEPDQPPEERFQRFAIAFDGRIVSLATIDFIENPEGISGDSGAQINGLGSIEQTKYLAVSLQNGPLRVRLKRIR